MRVDRRQAIVAYVNINQRCFHACQNIVSFQYAFRVYDEEHGAPGFAPAATAQIDEFISAIEKVEKFHESASLVCSTDIFQSFYIELLDNLVAETFRFSRRLSEASNFRNL